MQPPRSPLLRGVLLLATLAAISIIMARSDNPARASTFNPHFISSVSDPTPGANADVIINFSVGAPDAFTNVKTEPSTQFIPRQWGVQPAPIGAIAGTFNALSTLGVFGLFPCVFPVLVPFTMHESSTDTSNLASALDLAASHPGGPGYSGQFATDPDTGLPGGVSRYPDFLNQIFPPAALGEPLARQWGGRMVLTSAVSLNILTFRPGQLPGFPATLGYPNVVILLNPVAPVDLYIINNTSDLCTPLSLTNTNFGVSRDNPATAADEGGYVRLTNPMSERNHTFREVTTSQPDADNDGIENMLDTCALAPNTQDLDGRNNGENPFGITPANPDGDQLDGACDPAPNTPSPISPEIFQPDEDLDGYANRADDCPLVPNGIHTLGFHFVSTGVFAFIVGHYADIIGPNNQADIDGDDIGDACDPDPAVIDGHMHSATLTWDVPIFKHGIKLNALGGPKTIKDGGARSYTVDVSNLGSNAEDVQVALRVVEGCAGVSGPSSVNVPADGSGSASFTVDFTGCAAGTYTVQADACHAGDPAPAGFFGSGACPGTSDGFTDPNALDDAPIAKGVEVGSP